jgi:hypothetical protein
VDVFRAAVFNTYRARQCSFRSFLFVYYCYYYYFFIFFFSYFLFRPFRFFTCTSDIFHRQPRGIVKCCEPCARNVRRPTGLPPVRGLCGAGLTVRVLRFDSGIDGRAENGRQAQEAFARQNAGAAARQLIRIRLFSVKRR